MLPILALITQGKVGMKDCLPALIAQFQLTAEEAEALLPSGKQSVISNRAHWARQYISQAGLVVSVRRGSYEVTDLGREFLASSPKQVTTETLKQFPKFLEFLGRSGRRDSPVGDVDHTGSIEPAILETPEALIARGHAQLDSALVAELLSAVQAMNSSRFEQLIVDLLLAMGYGGGDRSMGERIGRSGDGGIDGIINEDALGLDAVYIQAKRYAPENRIGRPTLQAFVGSLTGEGANKGVFVTTSDFSKEAREYLNRVQHRIVLINGDRLARLLIQHEVGVRARQTYVLRSVDEDYFSDI